MSRIVKCDRCGITFPADSDNSGYIKMGWRSIRGADLYIDQNPYEDFDFCESCMEEIRACVETGAEDRAEEGRVGEEASIACE